MARLLVVSFCLISAFYGVHAEKNPEEDFRKLPKLFHLDDYERCMERRDGLYCVGLFEIYNEVEPNPLYDLIQEKSQDISLYNRTLLHRGYCLPTRCPSGEQNATARFEHCVDAWARSHSLRTRLKTLHYCETKGLPHPRAADTTDLPHRLFLYFIYFIIAMGVIGTVYDCFFAVKGKRDPYLMAFSARVNWSHLTSNYQDISPSLKQLDVFNGIRFILGIGLMTCHAIILTTVSYQHNPRTIEKILSAPPGFMLGASMIFTLAYIMMSNFLVAYNLLLTSSKANYSLQRFPLYVLKRVIRMYPVYLLLNAFGATWWRSFGSGPLWPILLANESDICKKKFWITAAFLQNLVNKKEICLVQTWVMAVDFQLYLLSLFITFILLKHRKHAIKVLLVLLAAATVLVTYYGFKYNMNSSYLYMTPETFRTLFANEDSFLDLYIHPVNGIMVSIAGILLAFLIADHQERGIKIINKYVVILLNLSPFIVYWWCYESYLHFRHFDPWMQNLMVLIERLYITVFAIFVIYFTLTHKGFLHQICSWRGLRTITKLSLSVSMCHWCINVLLLTNRWALHDTTGFRIIQDVISVHVLSHLVSFPLTLFVEFPLQKFFDRIINRTDQRWFSPLKFKPE